MEHSHHTKTSAESGTKIAGAIVAAGIIVALAIIFTSGERSPRATNGETETAVLPSGGTATNPIDTTEATKDAATIKDTDHVRGNKKAKVVIYEYSDLECPFCKQFHGSVIDIVDKYPNDVAWVYRHFPLSIHPKAPEEARASECAAEVGGNDGFWKFVDIIFEKTPANNGLDLALLPTFAEEAGISRSEFEECMADTTRYRDVVEAGAKEAIAIGARGTPYSLIASKKGTVIPIEGARGADTLATVEQLLAE